MEIALGILTDAFFITLLIWCAYTDIRTRTVPNTAVILLMCLGLANTALLIISGSAWWPHPAGLALGIPFFIAWHKNVIGAGDVKLLMGISLYLGTNQYTNRLYTHASCNDCPHYPFMDTEKITQTENTLRAGSDLWRDWRNGIGLSVCSCLKAE